MARPHVPDSNGTDPRSSVFTAVGHDIDTVHLRVDEVPFVEDADGSADVVPRALGALRELDSFEEHVGAVGWLRSTARLRNLLVTVRPGVLRVRGSLAAFIAGTNAAPFDHAAVWYALEEIAEAIDVPLPVLLAARVMRLDVGVNVPTDGPVEEVTGSLVAVPPRRLVQRGRASVGVELTTRGLYVYDKRAERGRRPVHPSYGDGPLMRVELRYTSKVARQVRRPVTAGLLGDRAFYQDLGVRLVEAADALPFRRVLTPLAPRTLPELRDAYALLGVEASGGFEAAFNAVEVDQRAGRLDPKRAYNLRQEIKRLRTLPRLTEPLDVAVGFRRAVREAVFGRPP